MDVYVVGIPDKKYGEQVLAAVMLKPGEKATDNEFIPDFAFGCTHKCFMHL